MVPPGHDGAGGQTHLRARALTLPSRATILGLLASLDVEACLRSGGFGDDDFAVVRARLLGPPA